MDMKYIVLKVGRMSYVQRHPYSKEIVYVPFIDLGYDFIQTIASGLAQDYSMNQLKDKLVVLLLNVKREDVYGVKSDGLLLCARSGAKVELLDLPPGTVPGDTVIIKNQGPPPDSDDEEEPPLSLSLDSVPPGMWVDDQKRALYNGSPLEVRGKGPIGTKILANCPIVGPLNIY